MKRQGKRFLNAVFGAIFSTVFLLLLTHGITSIMTFTLHNILIKHPYLLLIFMLAALPLQSSKAFRLIVYAIIVIEWFILTLLFSFPFLQVYISTIYALKLPLVYKLHLLDSLPLTLAGAFILGAVSLFAIYKNQLFRYTVGLLLSMGLIIISIENSYHNFRTLDNRIRNIILNRGYEINNVEAIISYPCKDSQQQFCKIIFGEGAIYDFLYHPPTKRLFFGSTASGSLLSMDSISGEIYEHKLNCCWIRFLAYDSYNDQILVNSHTSGVVGISPYNFKEIAHYFKNLKIKYAAEKGCLTLKEDLLVYTSEGEPRLLIRNQASGEERSFSVFPISTTLFIYGISCMKDSVIISMLSPVPLFKRGLMIVQVNPEFKILKKRRLILPALDMERDLTKNQIYIARPISGQVDIFQIADLEKVGSIKVFKGVRELALDGKRGYLYASNFGSGDIVKINLATKRIEKRYNAGPLLRAIVFVDELDAVFAASALGVFKLKD